MLRSDGTPPPKWRVIGPKKCTVCGGDGRFLIQTPSKVKVACAPTHADAMNYAYSFCAWNRKRES